MAPLNRHGEPQAHATAKWQGSAAGTRPFVAADEGGVVKLAELPAQGYAYLRP